MQFINPLINLHCLCYSISYSVVTYAIYIYIYIYTAESSFGCCNIVSFKCSTLGIPLFLSFQITRSTILHHLIGKSQVKKKKKKNFLEELGSFGNFLLLYSDFKCFYYKHSQNKIFSSPFFSLAFLHVTLSVNFSNLSILKDVQRKISVGAPWILI